MKGVQNREQRGQYFPEDNIPELELLLGRSLTRVLEFRLDPGHAVEKRFAFSL